MTFKYQDYFDTAPSSGYETLIYDCMMGDAILFQRADAIEAGWRAVQPFLDAWRNAGTKPVARDLPRPISCSLAMAGGGGQLREIRTRCHRNVRT